MLISTQKEDQINFLLNQFINHTIKFYDSQLNKELSKPNTKSKIEILNLENQPIRLPMMCEYNYDIQSLELLHYQKPDDYIFFFKVTTNSNSFDPLEFHCVIKNSKEQMREIFDDLDNNRICLFNDHDKI